MAGVADGAEEGSNAGRSRLLCSNELVLGHRATPRRWKISEARHAVQPPSNAQRRPKREKFQLHLKNLTQRHVAS